MLPAVAAAAPLTPKDFARGVEVFADDATPVHTLTLPLELYRGVTRTDLGDVRVFNKDEEPVPHAIRSLARADAERPAALVLPIFPLRGPPGARFDDLSLHVRRSDSGTIISFDAGGTLAPDATVQAYLIDASAAARPLRRLILDWAAPQAGFLARVSLEATEDLAHWRSVEPNASVAHLDYRGHSLDRRSIDLTDVRAKYLRLRWSSLEAPFVLEKVEADLVPTAGEPQRESLALDGQADSTAPGTYVFDLGGPIPVDRLEVELPQNNTLVRAEVQSAGAAEGPWKRRFAGELYRVTYEGEELTSGPIHVRPNTDRWWRLVVEEKGGGLGKGLPVLHTAWLPQQLLFVARGEGPFLLAFGSYAAGPDSFDAQSLVALVPGQKVETLDVQTASLGAARELGGAEALTPPPPPTPWKVWLLWGLLVGGVLLLGWMTVRLVRQLNAAGDGEGGASDAG